MGLMTKSTPNMVRAATVKKSPNHPPNNAAPDECGNTTIEEHFEHTVHGTFQFILFQNDGTAYGKDDTVCRVTEHQPKENKIKWCKNRCGIDVMSCRQAIHAGNAFKGCYHTIVVQQDRNFLIGIRFLNIIVEFVLFQQIFHFFSAPLGHPSVKIKYGFCTKHIPDNFCPVTPHTQTVI